MADPSFTSTPLSGGPTAPATGITPYVPPDQSLPEFTFRAVVLGAALGIVFGASSLYLVLRVGMTVSASIPVAVLAITVFRALSRAFRQTPTTILENNITQTAGSAGESIAFGVGVTMPALMILGFDMDLPRVMIVSILGGLLGILMMIPLRRAFIVDMHPTPGKPKDDTLLYPEGTACAEVLITGEKGGTEGKTVFIGFGVAFFAKFLVEGMSILSTMFVLPISFFHRVAKLSSEVAPELIGVGYVIGIRVAAIMMAGAVIGNLVIVPIVAQFVDTNPAIKDMALLKSIQVNYLRFIGAGAVTAAGIISMFKTMPMIIRSFRSSLGKVGHSGGGHDRTERDLPPSVVLFGSLGLLAILGFFLTRALTENDIVGAWWKGILGAGLVLLFGFLFVTVSSRLTGEIGSSSNPISGMTVATLALTCLIFLSLGMTTPAESVIALSVGAVVCIAASNGGTTSQDLKTGFLVGGTPIYMQYAILIGALSSALVIGFILLVFNEAGTVHTRKNLPPYQLTEDEYAALKEDVIYRGKAHRVWRPAAGDASGVPAGTYFVNVNRQVAFHPAISKVNVEWTVPAKDYDAAEELTYQGKKYRVYTVKEDPKAEEKEARRPGTYLVAENRQPVLDMEMKPTPVYALSDEQYAAIKEETTFEGQTYKVWRARRGNEAGVPSGKYFIDAEHKIAVLEDPAITGRVTTRDDGSEVKMKFEAPKTEVIGIIINGVLERKLNWGLVLIGAMLAVGLELCGVSSLAFAVGVYIPMQYTTPIFLGGLVRYFAEWYTTPLQGAVHEEDEAKALAKSETGPGVLLASGYIAGGTIAGVVIAFLELPFFDVVKKAIDFARKPPDTAGPALDYSRWGLDLAPVPLILALVAFLALVGAGILLGPKKDSK